MTIGPCGRGRQVRVNAVVCLTCLTKSGCFGRDVLVDAVLPTLRVRACLSLIGVSMVGSRRNRHALIA